MNLRITLLMIATLSFGIVSLAQDHPGKHFPAQLSLVYPVGTGWVKSPQTGYNFSLNILAGATGSIDGCEIGGLMNLNKTDVRGVQVAGIGSVTEGNFTGVRVGGIFGTSHTFKGVQVNGILTGTNHSNGVIVSGIINFTRDANVTVAGIANANLQSVHGVQLAGVFNITDKLDGVQIGLFNVVDSVDKGVSIGLVSVARHGRYQQGSVSFSDYMNVGLNYRSGTKALYNVYSAGINFMADPLWVAGFGFGHLSEISGNFNFQPELVCYTYFPTDFRHIRETYALHLKIGFAYEISERFSVAFAPSIYGALKSNEGKYEEAGYDQSPIGPIISHANKNGNSVLEAGFGLSVEFGIN